jgi:hypothetical protein
MTEKKPISIYLSPLASDILSQYVKKSGYGSISRTVEEIILAFDDVYSIVATQDHLVNQQAKNDPEIIPAILSYANSTSMERIRYTLTRVRKTYKAVAT